MYISHVKPLCWDEKFYSRKYQHLLDSRVYQRATFISDRAPDGLVLLNQMGKKNKNKNQTEGVYPIHTHMSRTERGLLLFGSVDICRMKRRGRVSLARARRAAISGSKEWDWAHRGADTATKHNRSRARFIQGTTNAFKKTTLPSEDVLDI